MFKVPDSLVDVLAKLVIGWYRARKLQQPTRAAVEETVVVHLRDVEEWSSRVEFSGFAQAKATDLDTVALSISLPRQYRGAKSSKPLSERKLIHTHGRNILLGGPGAGKTTTLKRIARKLLHEPAHAADDSQYPLVVRLRELTIHRLLEEAIASALSIPAERRHINDTNIPRAEISKLKQTQPAVDVGDRSGPFYFAVNGDSLIAELGRLLEESRALLLLDGLDEVPPRIRHIVEDTIIRLIRIAPAIPILVTCRSGDYDTPIEGLDVLELLPLNPTQIETIVKRWSHDPVAFMQRLESLAFEDLASRPLFLCQLILLHETTNFIPAEPQAVYRRIVKLALEEWDRQKRVFRESRYADFDLDRKLEFFSQLAYWLTYELREKQFTSATLQRAYRAIAPNFNLPLNEANVVVRELEAHTGIVVNAGYDRYEFSHLSIQEFLAANFLVREPITEIFLEYLRQEAAPVAVAVGLSSTPSKWFSRLLLHPAADNITTYLRSFLSRVTQERPSFKPDEALGYAALRLVFLRSDDEYLNRFLAIPAVQASIALALRAYDANRHGGGYMLKLERPLGPREGLKLPTHGWISRDYLNLIMNTYKVDFVEPLTGSAHHCFSSISVDDAIRRWSGSV